MTTSDLIALIDQKIAIAQALMDEFDRLIKELTRRTYDHHPLCSL